MVARERVKLMGPKKKVLTNRLFRCAPDYGGEIAEHRLFLTEVHRHPVLPWGSVYPAALSRLNILLPVSTVLEWDSRIAVRPVEQLTQVFLKGFSTLFMQRPPSCPFRKTLRPITDPGRQRKVQQIPPQQSVTRKPTPYESQNGNAIQGDFPLGPRCSRCYWRCARKRSSLSP